MLLRAALRAAVRTRCVRSPARGRAQAVLGVDPGKDGALVLVHAGGEESTLISSLLQQQQQQRKQQVTAGTGKRRSPRTAAAQPPRSRDYDVDAIAKRLGALAAQYDISLAVLEQQHARPVCSKRASFSLGMGYGIWRGVLRALRLETVTVHPSTWHAQLGLSKRKSSTPTSGAGGSRKETKGRAIEFCQEHLPGLDLTPGRRRVCHDGLADAACLALYGRDVILRQQQDAPRS